ncbi:hypothetical protein F5H01DRAFT_354353 [Linnemannia elongata]|nr:hypothetical protein F5H01DRAFT_354353 [Linnemannia elongata]
MKIVAVFLLCLPLCARIADAGFACCNRSTGRLFDVVTDLCCIKELGEAAQGSYCVNAEFNDVFDCCHRHIKTGSVASDKPGAKCL